MSFLQFFSKKLVFYKYYILSLQYIRNLNIKKNDRK